MPYIAYDVRGIQQFIYSIPKLKFIVGASSSLDRFDSIHARQIAKGFDGRMVFSGGGKGIIYFSKPEDKGKIKEKLLDAAKILGVDLRLNAVFVNGVAQTLTEALEGADELFPFVPDNLDGEPCGVSGLWPAVPAGKGWLANAHPVVENRYKEYKKDIFGKDILEEVKKRPEWPAAFRGDSCEFMKNVSPDATDDADDQAHAEAAKDNLGARNRWAIVAMDGNDIGRQQRALDGLPGEEKEKALSKMSKKLRACTRSAFLHGLAAAVAAWAKRFEEEKKKIAKSNAGKTVLPFRPLILGGDDILALCHVEHAFDLARDMAKAFEAESEKDKDCWMATGGKLTISAGVLFCNVGYPLHTAIPYAESLLASAKGRFRGKSGEKEPSPAAIDWEAVTENLLDHPADRRRRELVFFDGDIEPDGKQLEVSLTRRPYKLYDDKASGKKVWDAATFDDLKKLAKLLEKIPQSVRLEIRRRLYAPWADRCAFVASLNKNLAVGDEPLSELLKEYDKTESIGKAWRDETKKDGTTGRDTAICDAIAVLEETRRMRIETA